MPPVSGTYVMDLSIKICFLFLISCSRPQLTNVRNWLNLGFETHLEFGNISAMLGSQLIKLGSNDDQLARRSVIVGSVSVGVVISRIQHLSHWLLDLITHLPPQLIHLLLTWYLQ